MYVSFLLYNVKEAQDEEEKHEQRPMSMRRGKINQMNVVISEDHAVHTSDEINISVVTT